MEQQLEINNQKRNLFRGHPNMNGESPVHTAKPLNLQCSQGVCPPVLCQLHLFMLKVIKYLGDNIFLYNFAYIQC